TVNEFLSTSGHDVIDWSLDSYMIIFSLCSPLSFYLWFNYPLFLPPKYPNVVNEYLLLLIDNHPHSSTENHQVGKRLVLKLLQHLPAVLFQFGDCPSLNVCCPP